jgi:hypothetical protein
MKDVRRQVALAVNARARLFNEMCEVAPVMSRLHQFASEFSAAATTAERAFAVIFAINPQVSTRDIQFDSA